MTGSFQSSSCKKGISRAVTYKTSFKSSIFESDSLFLQPFLVFLLSHCWLLFLLTQAESTKKGNGYVRAAVFRVRSSISEALIKVMDSEHGERHTTYLLQESESCYQSFLERLTFSQHFLFDKKRRLLIWILFGIAAQWKHAFLRPMANTHFWSNLQSSSFDGITCIAPGFSMAILG